MADSLVLNGKNASYDYRYRTTFDTGEELTNGFRMTYNGNPVVYIPKEWADKGSFKNEAQYYQPQYLNKQVWDYLKPATLELGEWNETLPTRSPTGNALTGYIIDEDKFNAFGLNNSAMRVNQYDVGVDGEAKISAPIQGISEKDGRLFYAGMRGGERAGEYTTYDAEGNSKLQAWKSGSSGWLGRGASGIAEFVNNIPAIGKIALALTVPGAAQAFAGFNVGQAIGRGDFGAAAMAALPLVVPGPSGAPPVVTVPGVDKMVGFISDTLGVAPATAGSLLQSAVTTAASGGGIETFLKDQFAQFVGNRAGAFASEFAKQFDVTGLEKMSRAIARDSTRALLLNQDVSKAASNAFITNAVPIAFNSVPGFSEWAKENPTLANGLQVSAIAAAKDIDPIDALQLYTKQAFVESAVPIAEKNLKDEGITINDNQRTLMKQTLMSALQDRPLDSALQNYALSETYSSIRNQVAQGEGWENSVQKQKAIAQYGTKVTPDEFVARQQGWEDLAAKESASKTYGPEVTPAEYAAKEAGWESAEQKATALTQLGPTTTPDQFAKWTDENTVTEAEVESAAKQLGIALTPEQTGALVGSYKQETLADEIRKLAQTGLEAVIPSAQATGQDRLVLPGPEKAEGAQPSDYRYFFDIMAQPDPQAAYAGLSAEQKAAVERASSEFGASSDERKLEMMTAYRTGALAPSETPTESWIDQAGLMPYETGDILDFLAQQEKEQAEMVAALEQKPRPVFPMEEQPTDLGNLIQLPSQDILQRMDQQAAEQRQMEQAVQTATGAPDALFEQRLSELLAQQDAEQEALAQALRGEIGGLGGTFSEQIAQADARRQAEQAAMEAALRGEYQSGFGSLEQQLAQQAAEQAAMESSLRSTFGTGMSDLERQIIAQAEQEAAERAAMEKALAEMGASTQQQIGQVETGLGQQISGLGQTIGGLSQQIGTATQGLQQQVARAQQQADLSGLLGLLGLMQQKEQPPAPIPVVGEIKPYEFGSNLLEGIYPSNKMGLFGANDQLLKMARG